MEPELAEREGKRKEVEGRPVVRIAEIADFAGREVAIEGWLYNRRSSGRLAFLLLRDGTGVLQCLLARDRLGEKAFAEAEAVPQEASLTAWGTVRADSRAPGGFELSLAGFTVHQGEPDYPITRKEHGPEFLLDHRHLWIRTPRQAAILRIRSQAEWAFQEFLNERGFVRVDGPILTPNAVEGTTTLFRADYFGEPAYLTQSSQLYAEAAAMALGRVYAFGPTFRAEKSKTRRHLVEFWMLEPEVAYATHEDVMRLAEELVAYAVARVLARCEPELRTLGRDLAPLRRVVPPFPVVSYDEAVELVRRSGLEMEWGDDFGAPQETAVATAFDRPVFVERYPAKAKAFYMQPDPARPEVVLCADLLAPEGYGEIVGGSQRIHDLDLLRERIAQFGLPEEAFRWYLDLRRWGSVPHSGFGLGLERFLAWICGLRHIRETIPFPRLLNRLTP
ncbi:MAG: asparagine--tRNA ligase [Clostridia bacterium]|nr:asparagine--tRNA ligase [Clostridia bacterium]